MKKIKNETTSLKMKNENTLFENEKWKNSITRRNHGVRAPNMLLATTGTYAPQEHQGL